MCVPPPPTAKGDDAVQLFKGRRRRQQQLKGAAAAAAAAAGAHSSRSLRTCPTLALSAQAFAAPMLCAFAGEARVAGVRWRSLAYGAGVVAARRKSRGGPKARPAAPVHRRSPRPPSRRESARGAANPPPLHPGAGSPVDPAAVPHAAACVARQGAGLRIACITGDFRLVDRAPAGSAAPCITACSARAARAYARA